MTRRSLVSIVTAVALALGLHVTSALAQGGGKLRPVRELPEQLIVKYKPGVSPQARSLALDNLGVETRVLKSFEFIRAELVEIKGLPTGVAQAVLTLDPNLEYAEPNYEWSIDITPNDPRFSEIQPSAPTFDQLGTSASRACRWNASR